MRRLSTRAAGLLILILGIWGGLVPFIGPYFHFAMGPDKSWTWTTGRFWLDVLPGIVAIVGGLMLLGAGPRPGGKLGALLALAAGLWFAIGPDVSLLWHASGAQGAAHGSKGIRVLEMLTYHTLLGAVMAALAGYALPGLATRRSLAAADAVEDEAPARPARPVVAPAATSERADRAERAERARAETPPAPNEAPLVAEEAADERHDAPIRNEVPSREPVRDATGQDVAAGGDQTAGEPLHAPARPAGALPANRPEARTAIIDRPATEQATRPTATAGGTAPAPSTATPDGTAPAPPAAPEPVTMRRRRGGLLSRLRG